jgi:hypothetical protein
MRKRITATLMLLALSLAGLAAVQAQGVQVQITSPGLNQVVRGRVPIIGSASVADFQFYKVEYGVGSDPSQWAVIGQLHDSPVINGELEVWDTTGLPDGVYSLQLQAVKQDGNWESFFVRGLTVANSSPTETPTPEVTPTETPTFDPGALTGATSEPDQPRATATIQIITPSADLRQATPTATLIRTTGDDGDSLPLNPANWREAFIYGAAAMGAVFILLGIVFGVRRLL